MIYVPVKFKVVMSNGLGQYIFTRKTLYYLEIGVKVTQNVAKYTLHHVTYAPAKFEVAKSNRFGGDEFTRKYI